MFHVQISNSHSDVLNNFQSLQINGLHADMNGLKLLNLDNSRARIKAEKKTINV